MKIIPVERVKNAEQARDLAIEFQSWQSEKSLSYSDLVFYQDYFKVLANKFNLLDEFQENGIL